MIQFSPCLNLQYKSDTRCQSCQDYTHSIKYCPYLHYQYPRSLIIQKFHNLEKVQQYRRQSFRRIQKSKNTLHKLQIVRLQGKQLRVKYARILIKDDNLIQQIINEFDFIDTDKYFLRLIPDLPNHIADNDDLFRAQTDARGSFYSSNLSETDYQPQIHSSSKWIRGNSKKLSENFNLQKYLSLKQQKNYALIQSKSNILQDQSNAQVNVQIIQNQKNDQAKSQFYKPARNNSNSPLLEGCNLFQKTFSVNDNLEKYPGIQEEDVKSLNQQTSLLLQRTQDSQQQSIYSQQQQQQLLQQQQQPCYELQSQKSSLTFKQNSFGSVQQLTSKLPKKVPYQIDVSPTNKYEPLFSADFDVLCEFTNFFPSYNCSKILQKINSKNNSIYNKQHSILKRKKKLIKQLQSQSQTYHKTNLKTKMLYATKQQLLEIQE